MLLKKVFLKGFRNFVDETIILNDKTLIIGANDVGKSNFLYALRILLDRSLSEADIEPRENDFCAFSKNKELSITLKFINVTEDCVLAKMKSHVSDEGEMFLRYQAKQDKGSYSYQFFAGHSIKDMVEIPSRFYLRVLNLKYIGSTRDLFSYIRSEKKHLLYEAKENRSEKETNQDSTILKNVGVNLDTINSSIRTLHYVKEATSSINKVLKKLAFHHEKEEVVLDVGASDPEAFTQNLRLATERNGRILESGGDGRNNQIFLALWSSRNASSPDLEFTIHCIEEPEAHLHPHQQRKLAEYLVQSLTGQAIISSHSSQIASEFSPDSLVRLLSDGNNGTRVASNGCSIAIEKSLYDFGYRLNAINAETFYADAVFLVEGASEVLFFRALSAELGIDLDRFNISVTMVDGVGFLPYVDILNAINVPWVIRTDNDIYKIPYKSKYRLAGLQRAIDIAEHACSLSDDDKKLIATLKPHITDLPNPSIPSSLSTEIDALIKLLLKFDIFVSITDLESDLVAGPLKDSFIDYYSENDIKSLLNIMQSAKATGMFNYLLKKKDCLKTLKGSSFHNQLNQCVKLVTEA